MKKKLSKVITIIIFSLFIGIVDVNAETCAFDRDLGGGLSERYTITINNGKVEKIIFTERSNGSDVHTENRTNSINVNITSCSSTNSINFNGVTYSKATNSGGNNEGGSPDWLHSEKVSCGNIGQIPAKGPELVHMFILIAQIAVPIILVILGMIDLAKGIMSQKEDDIKKGQKTFINRLIMGAVIFFIVALVKLLVGIVVDNTGNRQNIIACIDCFVNNDCN